MSIEPSGDQRGEPALVPFAVIRTGVALPAGAVEAIHSAVSLLSATRSVVVTVYASHFPHGLSRAPPTLFVRNGEPRLWLCCAAWSHETLATFGPGCGSGSGSGCGSGWAAARRLCRSTSSNSAVAGIGPKLDSARPGRGCG